VNGAMYVHGHFRDMSTDTENVRLSGLRRDVGLLSQSILDP
jgi:hypothetical protein